MTEFTKTDLNKKPIAQDTKTCEQTERKCTSCLERPSEAFKPFSGGNFKSLTIVYTYKCTAECEHCSYKCDPTREETLGFNMAQKLIIEAAEQGFNKLTLRGGECLLFADDILALSDKAKNLGMSVEVITNAYWAMSKEKSQELLELLGKAGVKKITMETGSFNVKFIPLKNVIYAIEEAIKRDILVNVEVWIDDQYSKQTKDMVEEIRKFSGKSVTFIWSYPKSSVCWKGPQSRYSLDKDEMDVCKSISLTVHPEGDVYCCCSPSTCGLVRTKAKSSFLFLGNLFEQSMHSIIELANYSPVLNSLRIAGPEALVEIWGNNEIKSEIPNSFSDICDYCLAVNNVFMKHPSALTKISHICGDEGIRERLIKSWEFRSKLFPREIV
jgi:pyruvate-formate lyase-activating enzyme